MKQALYRTLQEFEQNQKSAKLHRGAQALYDELAAVLQGEPLTAPERLDTPDAARVRARMYTSGF